MPACVGGSGGVVGVGCPDFPELSEGSVTSKLFFLLLFFFFYLLMPAQPTLVQLLSGLHSEGPPDFQKLIFL